MAFDLQATISQLTDKIGGDSNLLSEFKQNPVKVLEKLIGKDLPDEKIQPVIDGIKAKLSLDSASGAIDKIKGLFGN